MAEIVKLDDYTFRIEDDFVRFFLLIGNKKALMIDSGANTPNAKELCEGLTKLPIMLANTHGDGDHASGTGAFKEIHMSPSDYYNCGIDKAFPGVSLVPLKEGDIIDLGGRTIEIYDIPGHTEGSIAFLDVEARRIFTGDSVQTGHIYMFGDKRNPDKYHESLRKLISISTKYDSVIASHDEPVLPYNSVNKVLECWNQVLKGEAPYEEIDLWGNKVKSCNCEYCGFYIQ